MSRSSATIIKIESVNGQMTVTARGDFHPFNVYVWEEPRYTDRISQEGQVVPIHQVGGYYYPDRYTETNTPRRPVTWD